VFSTTSRHEPQLPYTVCMCSGPNVPKDDDVKVKIALGVRRFWDSEEGQAEKRLRRELAREIRIERAAARLNQAADAKPF
jgi:hypothetical protein